MGNPNQRSASGTHGGSKANPASGAHPPMVIRSSSGPPVDAPTSPRVDRPIPTVLSTHAAATGTTDPNQPPVTGIRRQDTAQTGREGNIRGASGATHLSSNPPTGPRDGRPGPAAPSSVHAPTATGRYQHASTQTERGGSTQAAFVTSQPPFNPPSAPRADRLSYAAALKGQYTTISPTSIQLRSIAVPAGPQSATAAPSTSLAKRAASGPLPDDAARPTKIGASRGGIAPSGPPNRGTWRPEVGRYMLHKDFKNYKQRQRKQEKLAQEARTRETRTAFAQGDTPTVEVSTAGSHQPNAPPGTPQQDVEAGVETGGVSQPAAHHDQDELLRLEEQQHSWLDSRTAELMALGAMINPTQAQIPREGIGGTFGWVREGLDDVRAREAQYFEASDVDQGRRHGEFDAPEDFIAIYWMPGEQSMDPFLQPQAYEGPIVMRGALPAGGSAGRAVSPSFGRQGGRSLRARASSPSVLGAFSPPRPRGEASPGAGASSPSVLGASSPPRRRETPPKAEASSPGVLGAFSLSRGRRGSPNSTPNPVFEPVYSERERDSRAKLGMDGFTVDDKQWVEPHDRDLEYSDFPNALRDVRVIVRKSDHASERDQILFRQENHLIGDLFFDKHFGMGSRLTWELIGQASVINKDCKPFKSIILSNVDSLFIPHRNRQFKKMVEFVRDVPTAKDKAVRLLIIRGFDGFLVALEAWRQFKEQYQGDDEDKCTFELCFYIDARARGADGVEGGFTKIVSLDDVLDLDLPKPSPFILYLRQRWRFLEQAHGLDHKELAKAGSHRYMGCQHTQHSTSVRSLRAIMRQNLHKARTIPHINWTVRRLEFEKERDKSLELDASN